MVTLGIGDGVRCKESDLISRFHGFTTSRPSLELVRVFQPLTP